MRVSNELSTRYPTKTKRGRTTRNGHRLKPQNSEPCPAETGTASGASRTSVQLSLHRPEKLIGNLVGPHTTPPRTARYPTIRHRTVRHRSVRWRKFPVPLIQIIGPLILKSKTFFQISRHLAAHPREFSRVIGLGRSMPPGRCRDRNLAVFEVKVSSRRAA